MTITNHTEKVDSVSVVIDGVEMEVPKGTLVIRAAEQIGIEIPRFCDHPLLVPVANCRACLIEIDGVPKPQPACAQVLSEGMNVRTPAFFRNGTGCPRGSNGILARQPPT